MHMEVVCIWRLYAYEVWVVCMYMDCVCIGIMSSVCVCVHVTVPTGESKAS